MTGDSKLDPITHAGVDRRGKWCRCSDCTIIRRCTPHSDFYAEGAGSPLRCEPCVMKHHKIVHIVKVPPGGAQ